MTDIHKGAEFGTSPAVPGVADMPYGGKYVPDSNGNQAPAGTDYSIDVRDRRFTLAGIGMALLIIAVAGTIIRNLED